MIRKKKVPLRMCIVCREMKDKRELLRLVKGEDNEIIIDDTGKKSGRGAYMCRALKCIESSKKTKVLNREFKMNIAECVYDDLKQRLEEVNGR